MPLSATVWSLQLEWYFTVSGIEVASNKGIQSDKIPVLISFISKTDTQIFKLGFSKRPITDVRLSRSKPLFESSDFASM